jgi:hypothetical protein
MEHINSVKVQGQQITQCSWPAIHDKHKHSQHKQYHRERKHKKLSIHGKKNQVEQTLFWEVNV